MRSSRNAKRSRNNRSINPQFSAAHSSDLFSYYEDFPIYVSLFYSNALRFSEISTFSGD